MLESYLDADLFSSAEYGWALKSCKGIRYHAAATGLVQKGNGMVFKKVTKIIRSLPHIQ
jgi:hypothetical protein